MDACASREFMLTRIAAALDVDDVSISGYAQPIVLRTYGARGSRPPWPIVIFFHGGRFISGGLEHADSVARSLALEARAVVVSVGYSLAPAYPFPAPLEDGYLAVAWVVENARFLAGHDAGGNIATCLAAMIRDRHEFRLRAQVLLAPLLDPSLTCMSDDRSLKGNDIALADCAGCYRAYLPNPFQRMHPYAAPLESRRLAGLAPTFIASAQHDVLHVEAERYAALLIAAGVSTEFVRYMNVSHETLVMHRPTISDVSSFLRKRFDEKA
jgi:acetyl esterase